MARRTSQTIKNSRAATWPGDDAIVVDFAGGSGVALVGVRVAEGIAGDPGLVFEKHEAETACHLLHALRRPAKPTLDMRGVLGRNPDGVRHDVL
jgi:hypothetical protein